MYKRQACNHCFQCIGLINQKQPEDLTAVETARLLEYKIYQLNLNDFSRKVNENFFKNGGYEKILYTLRCDTDPVSYTHLDVYKRQFFLFYLGVWQYSFFILCLCEKACFFQAL